MHMHMWHVHVHVHVHVMSMQGSPMEDSGVRCWGQARVHIQLLCCGSTPRLTRVGLHASPAGLRNCEPELRTPRERCRVGRRRRLPLAGGGG